MEISNHEAPNDIENQYIALRTSIGNKLNSLPPLSPLRCIYRVPERLRHGNEKAYTPQVVSIGPLHHGKEHLNAMEEHKIRCLQSLLSRTQVSVNYYINKIKDQEARLRSCYAEIIKFDSDQLVEIVLVDAAFIIELFLGNYSPKFQLEDNYIFKSPIMERDVLPDMQLLENQLPFFIVEDLFYRDKLFSSSAGVWPSLIEISYHFFKFAIFRYSTEDCLKRISSSEVEIKHFVDLIRFMCLPSKSEVGGLLKTVNTPSITEMHQAGVKCKKGSTRNLFGIGFADGTLVIPQFVVHRNTEVIIRNLTALEQCHYEQRYITDFVVLMMRFLKTPKDVQLLVEHGIVENYLTDTSGVSALFTNLAKGTTASKDFYFASLCEELNTHCRSPWNKWKANLRQNYLHTPWAVMSMVAAAVLLILTLIQTACSIISVAQSIEHS